MNTSLIIQIGPVQDFIAQARTTRDLWSGSYLLSWMMGQLVNRLRKRSATLVFPFVENDAASILTWISGTRSADPIVQKHALAPSIPNRILANLPPNFDREAVEELIREVFDYDNAQSVWRTIADECWRFFKDEGHPLADNLRSSWDCQLKQFWQTSWILWPELTREEIFQLYQSIPLAPAARFTASQLSGDSIWTAEYQLASHRLDARRQTRNFSAWHGVDDRNKDYFSGREEVVVDKKWLATIPRGHDGRSHTLNHLFRSQDELGAVSVVKRVWHKAYLQGSAGFNHENFYMPSIPGIAAFPWVLQVSGKLHSQGLITEFARRVSEIDRVLDFDLPMTRKGESEADWLKRVDWQIFQDGFWEELVRDNTALSESESEVVKAGRDCLDELKKAGNLGAPGAYYAVVAIDGDSMGKWLSGEKLGRPFDKAFHQKLSKAMVDCSRQFSRLFIEDPEKFGEAQAYPYQGKLIYSGGDDLLAILPATQAIDCARHFRREFHRLMAEATGVETDLGAGFTVSAGIAIGHFKEPLQDMVQEAHNALACAKRDIDKGGWGRDALAITLFKRSGETIQWGTRFEWSALDLLDFFQKHYRATSWDPDGEQPITGRFPHRLVELLRRYGAANTIAGLTEIVDKEVQWVVAQQTRQTARVSKEALDTLRGELCHRAHDCLTDLTERPLAEFYNLFLIEAFIARQKD